MKRSSLFAATLLLLFLPSTLSALGVYEDLYDLSAILTAPMQRSVTAGMLRAEGQAYAASSVSFAADYQLKSRLLLRAELSYTSLSTSNGIESGFGDLRFRTRAALLQREGLHLFATGALRAGSGSNAIYPFSSGSLDVQIGIGFVDSLALLSLWGEATAVRVSNKPGGLNEDDHADHAAFSLGLTVPLTGSLAFLFGGSGVLFRGKDSREIYFAGCEFRRSRFMHFFAAVQAEGGSRANRVNDFGLRSGMRIFY